MAYSIPDTNLESSDSSTVLLGYFNIESKGIYSLLFRPFLFEDVFFYHSGKKLAFRQVYVDSSYVLFEWDLLEFWLFHIY